MREGERLRKVLGGQGVGGVDRDFLTIAAEALEANDAVDRGKEGEVFAGADILAGVKGRTDLTNDDAACADFFAGVDFYAAELGVGVTAVTR